jgi:hypothetical protein
VRPLHVGAAVVVVVLSSPLLAGGCPGDPVPCPNATVTQRAPEPGGTVSWAYAGESGSGAPGAAGPTESVRATAGWVDNVARLDPETQTVRLNEWVGVQIPTEAGLIFIDTPLGEIRDWAVGALTVPPVFANPEGPPGNVRVSVPEPDCERCAFCMGVASGAEVEVLEAVGGARPYPEVVSADFRRVYRLRVDVSDVVSYRGSSSGGRVACSSPVSVALDLTFALDASHVEARPDDVCD